MVKRLAPVAVIAALVGVLAVARFATPVDRIDCGRMTLEQVYARGLSASQCRHMPLNENGG